MPILPGLHPVCRGDTWRAVDRFGIKPDLDFLLVPKLGAWARTLPGKLRFRGGAGGAIAPPARPEAEFSATLERQLTGMRKAVGMPSSRVASLAVWAAASAAR